MAHASRSRRTWRQSRELARRSGSGGRSGASRPASGRGNGLAAGSGSASTGAFGRQLDSASGTSSRSGSSAGTEPARVTEPEAVCHASCHGAAAACAGARHRLRAARQSRATAAGEGLHVQGGVPVAVRGAAGGEARPSRRRHHATVSLLVLLAVAPRPSAQTPVVATRSGCSYPPTPGSDGRPGRSGPPARRPCLGDRS